MKSLIILVGIIPIAIIPVLIILRTKSHLRNHYLLVLVFVGPLTLVFTSTGGPRGVYDGGSIFINLSILYLSAVPLIALLISRPQKDIHITRPKNLASGEVLRFCWIIIFILGLYAAFKAETKLMPFALTIMFGITLFLIFAGDFNFDMLLVAVYRIFAIISSATLISFILRFNWENYTDVQLQDLDYDSSVYFSPLSKIFGLPARAAGPFGAPTVASMFYIFGLACFFASRFKEKNYLTPFLFLICGSLTGTRTFYVAVLTLFSYLLIKRFLPKNFAMFWASLISFMAIAIFVVVNLVLPVLISDTATLNNLTGRTELWQFILERWNSDGVFGHGPGTLSRFTYDSLGFGFSHAHNSILQYLWDFGLAGLAIIILFFVAQLIAVSYERKHDVIGVALCLLTIQTEPTLVPSVSLVEWFWLIPLCAVFSRDLDDKSRSEIDFY